MSKRQNGSAAVMDESPTPAGGVQINIPPLAEVPEGTFCPRHVEVSSMSPKAREALKRLEKTLYNSHATVSRPGRSPLPVNSPARAVLWLLEQVGEAC